MPFRYYPRYVHQRSHPLYVEPNAVVPLGNCGGSGEKKAGQKLRRAITEQVAAVKPDLERLLVIATTLDLACARARYSFGWEPIRPLTAPEKLSPAAVVIPRGGSSEQGQPVVPIDLLIQPQIRVVTITGPNTGKKPLP